MERTTLAADLTRTRGWALERGIELADLEVSRPTLEDVYLKLTRGDDQNKELTVILLIKYLIRACRRKSTRRAKA